ncbi:unnamed protein product [Caenorhabditis auriculariae]|uniref:Integrin beta subunit VWA domain-containing protein n=1 Tax=Caenorhabditis auriculariae TaxID=2777116 RepID=A0A8S1H002_9PELO|nr:unnamed protein product [Caenorhabditis auriculariae]
MRSLLIYLLLCAIAFADDTAFLCSQADAQLSCGQCIKKHPDCAWCTDPHSTAKNRCQLKTLFVNNSCHPSYVYSPPQAQVTVLKPTYPLESTKSDGTVVRLEPQQVSIRLMPGNAVNVPFKYLNRAGATTMEIQTSEYQNTALKLKFFINCDGAEKETKTCAVRENQIVEFRVEATLETCSSQGDITLSLGVRGQQIISALYVTPICGCECEKHNERNSPLCHQHGHLICGQCICDASRGGDKCECALSLYGVSSSAQLDAQCRDEESSEVCNGQGVCQCGKCRCNSPTISGKFCQCDHTSCPKGANGQICSSNGVCDCGKCKCEVGWEREDCSCSTANSNCLEKQRK